LYVLSSERIVLYAATHSVPAALKISHGRSDRSPGGLDVVSEPPDDVVSAGMVDMFDSVSVDSEPEALLDDVPDVVVDAFEFEAPVCDVFVDVLDVVVDVCDVVVDV
jgi:hypothetical protein